MCLFFVSVVCTVVSMARFKYFSPSYFPEKTDIFQLSEHRVITLLLGKEVELG